MSVATRERPMLMSAPMVKALLEGRKTQTRRLVKLPKERGDWEPITVGGPGVFTSSGDPAPRMACIWNTLHGRCIACPHGQPGDRLWVREAVAINDTGRDRGDRPPLEDGNRVHWLAEIHYRSDGEVSEKWVHIEHWRVRYENNRLAGTPSIHMPRWASRITLEITDVRVERASQISPQDAYAEGARCSCMHPVPACKGNIDAFRDIWDSINGKSCPWDSDPWLWAIEFKVVDQGRG